MTTMQEETCKMALKAMMQKGRFDICTIRDILKLTGGVPQADDMRTLECLHCVNFTEFTPVMRMEFPALLERVLSSPSMDIEIKFKPLSRPLTLIAN